MVRKDTKRIVQPLVFDLISTLRQCHSSQTTNKRKIMIFGFRFLTIINPIITEGIITKLKVNQVLIIRILKSLIKINKAIIVVTTPKGHYFFRENSESSFSRRKAAGISFGLGIEGCSKFIKVRSKELRHREKESITAG